MERETESQSRQVCQKALFPTGANCPYSLEPELTVCKDQSQDLLFQSERCFQDTPGP